MALGAGFKIFRNTHWLIGGEYLYVNFGNVNAQGNVVCIADGACPANTGSLLHTAANLHANLFKLSADYLF